MSLLALVPWYWRWLALVGLILGSMAFGAAKMHAHDQKAIEKLEQDIAKVEAAAAAREAERKRQSDNLIKEKDDAHETEIAAADAYWSAYADRVRHGAGSGSSPQPVRITSAICNDPARDQQLSGALTVARSEFRDALAEYRAGLGGLFAACEVQTADLINVQDWAAHEQLLNQGVH